MRRIRYISILCILFLASCATTRTVISPREEYYVKGIWHRVKEGQTLWRIAKTYRISLEDIKMANDIEDIIHIVPGTWIFIPNATRQLYVQGSLDTEPEGKIKINFVWPAEGKLIKPFGKNGNDFNYGIDIQTKINDKIVAINKGTVVLESTIRGYGDTIIIEHDRDFYSLYSNLISLVKEGQQVEKNTIIAKPVPSKNSDDGIIHFELFYKGKPINPLYYLP